MLQEEKLVWYNALLMVPAQWRRDFCRFAENGEASAQFLEFFALDPRCREAFEMVLRGDRATAGFVKAAGKKPR
jgi:hypothetical protein